MKKDHFFRFLLLSSFVVAFAFGNSSKTNSGRALVTVNVDGTAYTCSASGGGGGGDLLVSGQYKKISGAENLCPQSIQATVTEAGMTALRVTYLGACGGGSTVMTCRSGQCTGDGHTITVLSRDLYYFINSSGIGGRFQLE